MVERMAVVVVAATVLLGCHTTYHPMGCTGGYAEVQLRPGVWEVLFKGNRYTSAKYCRHACYLRCGELTKKLGYDTLDILSEGGWVDRKAAYYTTPTRTRSSTVSSRRQFRADAYSSSPYHTQVTGNVGPGHSRTKTTTTGGHVIPIVSERPRYITIIWPNPQGKLEADWLIDHNWPIVRPKCEISEMKQKAERYANPEHQRMRDRLDAVFESETPEARLKAFQESQKQIDQNQPIVCPPPKEKE